MNAPIYDFIEKLNNSEILRCFMPGHKGRFPEKSLENLYRYDITEIKGADSLFESDGIISESEKMPQNFSVQNIQPILHQVQHSVFRQCLPL